MRMNRLGFILVIAALLALGAVPGTDATVCDDDPAAVPFYPTVDPGLINGVLATLGVIPIVDVVIEAPFVQDFEHTMNIVMNGDMDLSVDFVVTPAVGSIEVVLTIPPWSADMFITVDHKPCYGGCQADLEACLPQCMVLYGGCVDDCVDYPTCCCGGSRPCCESACSGVLHGCNLDCHGDKIWCDSVLGRCIFERDLLNNLIDEHTVGISYMESTVSQVADVCVTGACRAIAPHESTTVDLVGFHVRYFPQEDDLGFGVWLNNHVTGFVYSMVDPRDLIEDAVVDEDRGVGLLVGAFGLEIMNDGCAPAPEVQACRGGACSIPTSPEVSTRQGASILLYSLPLLVMGGLILWKRRR